MVDTCWLSVIVFESIVSGYRREDRSREKGFIYGNFQCPQIDECPQSLNVLKKVLVSTAELKRPFMKVEL